MKRLIFIALAFLSGKIFATELNLTHQYLHMNKYGKSGKLAQLNIRTQASQKFSIGISSQYLERFSLYESSLGPEILYKINDQISLEAKYLKAKSDSEILALDQYILSTYLSHSPGYSSVATYQNSKFSLTHLQFVRWAIEIERLKHLIIIPYALIGQAHFHDPFNTREINNFGAKVISQHLENYRFIVFASKGIEATQALIGRSSQTIETKTIGGGIGHNFSDNLRIDTLFDYSDLGKLKNQFLTTTLNINWIY